MPSVTFPLTFTAGGSIPIKEELRYTSYCHPTETTAYPLLKRNPSPGSISCDGTRVGETILKSGMALFLPRFTTSTRSRVGSIVLGCKRTKSEVKVTFPESLTGECLRSIMAELEGLPGSTSKLIVPSIRS